MARWVRRIERTLTQQDFDSFARLSGDDNPIHVDAAYAAGTRFGRTVAHGMLLASIFRGLLEDAVPGRRQRELELMFPAPTFADEAMRFTVQADTLPDGTITASMCCVRIADGTTTCSGTTTLDARGVAA